VAKLSAGILLYRLAQSRDGVEVFLVHPGGPFWAKKDDGAWSIPKGLVDPDEDHAAAARREFAEEVGAVPPGELVRLGEVRQSGKNVIGFALEGDFDPAALVSNTIEIEWPPRTGRRQIIPEVDRAGWFSLDIAHKKLVPGQRPFIDTLARLMNKDPTLAPSR
jgi:predicted NUDIX family NTP pyrophosphohydrolase